jgi:hypothetical protein
MFEGWFRDTCFFIGNCSSMVECHQEWPERHRRFPSQCCPFIGEGESHMEQVKYALEHTRSVSCTATAREVGTPPANVYCILTRSLEKGNVCANWFQYMLNDDRRAMIVFLVVSHLQGLRN